VPTGTKLATSFEAPRNEMNGHWGNRFTGYFKAPISARFRFYMACDDQCKLSFSNETLNPSAKVDIITLNSWSNYRDYLKDDGSQMSSWHTLQAGGLYYIEAAHAQF
jgi:hypothetical protein